MDAVVFVHAFPFDGRMWEAQARVAESLGWTAVTPDLPGFGGRPPAGADLAGWAGEVLAECDRRGIGRAVFAGLSMGGYVVFRVAALAPERVAGLVLADTRAAADAPAAQERRTALAARVRAEGVAFLAGEVLPALLGETSRRERPDLVAEVRRRILAANPEGVARALLAMRDRPDSTPLLSGLRVPALVLVGAEDTLTPPDEARNLAGSLPHARFREIPAAGHLSNLENPEAFNAVLAEFLGEWASRP